MTADELHALAVRTRDAARLAERHGTSTHGYRRAAREACERMGEMAADIEPLRANFLNAMDRLRAAERERDEAHLAIDQALGGGMEDLERQLAEMEREHDEAISARNAAVARTRAATQAIVGAIGSVGPESIEDAVARIVGWIGTLLHSRAEALEAVRCESSLRARWERRADEARAELRDLVAALSLDDGPRAKAIQHARSVLEEWGMR